MLVPLLVVLCVCSCVDVNTSCCTREGENAVGSKQRITVKAGGQGCPRTFYCDHLVSRIFDGGIKEGLFSERNI
jgi:hypothetical protein